MSGVGITISAEQAELARARCDGFPVRIQLLDYRDINESFDRVFSIGIFELVGVKNYRRYFEIARRCLRPDELFLLHTIGSDISAARTDRGLPDIFSQIRRFPRPRRLRRLRKVYL